MTKSLMHKFFTLTILAFATLTMCMNASLSAQTYTCKLSENIFEGIIPFAHSSTICEAKNGDLLCAFFGGIGEKKSDTSIYLSIKEKGKSEWTKPVEVANALEKDGKRFASWNPVLFVEESGRIHLYYKLGDSPRTWLGFVKYSDDNGRTWSKQEALGKDLIGPAKNKPLLYKGKLILPSSREFHASFGWSTHFEIFENGKFVEEISVPQSIKYGLIQPAILQKQDGSLIAFMRSRVGKIYYSTSKDGTIWEKPQATSIYNPNSGLDAILLKNGKIALICNPTKDNRKTLSIFISDDTNSWREIFTQTRNTTMSYPTIIQTQDGSIHASFSASSSGKDTITHIQLIENK